MLTLTPSYSAAAGLAAPRCLICRELALRLTPPELYPWPRRSPALSVNVLVGTRGSMFLDWRAAGLALTLPASDV